MPLGPGGISARIDAVAVLRLGFMGDSQSFDRTASFYQLEENIIWVSGIGLQKLVGVDGGCDEQAGSIPTL